MTYYYEANGMNIEQNYEKVFKDNSIYRLISKIYLKSTKENLLKAKKIKFIEEAIDGENWK